MLNYINNLNCEIARADLLRHFASEIYDERFGLYPRDKELGTNQRSIKWLRDNNKIKSRETSKAPFKIMLSKL